MARGWPVTLAEGPVGLRPIRRRDREAWVEVRGRNFEWLSPWEATPPRDGRAIAFPGMVRNLTALTLTTLAEEAGR